MLRPSECKPGHETCCMQNSNDLPDFCVGGSGQPAQCASDKATVTVLECDDGEDCALAGKPGTVCCAQARTFDIDPSLRCGRPSGASHRPAAALPTATFFAARTPPIALRARLARNSSGPTPTVSRGYGSKSTLPVVARPSRAWCARAASRSGNVAPMRTLSAPLATHESTSPARATSSSRVAT